MSALSGGPVMFVTIADVHGKRHDFGLVPMSTTFRDITTRCAALLARDAAYGKGCAGITLDGVVLSPETTVGLWWEYLMDGWSTLRALPAS